MNRGKGVVNKDGKLSIHVIDCTVPTLEVTSGLDGYQDLPPFSLKGNFKEDGKLHLIGRN